MNNKIHVYRSLLIGVLLTVSLTAAGPSYAHGQNFALDVVVDGEFSMVSAPVLTMNGPFYISGTIFAPGTTSNPIGTFHCWGYFHGVGDDEGLLAVVSQEFDLDGRGKIQTQGVEDGGPRAVVGGTGDFANVRGQATRTEFNADLTEFTIRFSLTGATHGK